MEYANALRISVKTIRRSISVCAFVDVRGLFLSKDHIRASFVRIWRQEMLGFNINAVSPEKVRIVYFDVSDVAL